MIANGMAQNTITMLEHMRIGVAWEEDYETAKTLIAKLNGLDLLYENLLSERDKLREQVNNLSDEGNPFVTAED